MKTITTPLAYLSDNTKRECQLVVKRSRSGLSPSEQAELAEIYRNVPPEPLSVEDVDRMGEEEAWKQEVLAKEHDRIIREEAAKALTEQMRKWNAQYHAEQQAELRGEGRLVRRVQSR